MPVSQVVVLPERQALVHLGLIDHLQTCWGDQD
jgi:hypothetical protein